jgi:chromosome segregation ATPase
MPTPSIQFPASQTPVQTSVQTETQQPSAARQGAPAPVLDGPGVRVSVTGSSLDKLVAKVKGESDNARLDTAKIRIAVILTTLSALNIQMTENQRNNLAQLEVLQAQLDELTDLLNADVSAKADADAKAAALEAQIAALENAVANAIKDGEAHRKQVEELKKTRAADDAELKAAETALARSEAALAAAQAGLDKARASLAATKERSAELQGDIAKLKSQIAAVDAKISECAAAIGDKALASIAASLRTTAADAAPETHETNADREKEEAKAVENDPLRVIRESLDRMDEAVRRTIEENRTELV